MTHQHCQHLVRFFSRFGKLFYPTGTSPSCPHPSKAFDMISNFDSGGEIATLLDFLYHWINGFG